MLRRGLFIGRACFGVSFLNSTYEHFAGRSSLLPCDPIVTRIGIYRSSVLSAFGIATAFGSFQIVRDGQGSFCDATEVWMMPPGQKRRDDR